MRPQSGQNSSRAPQGNETSNNPPRTPSPPDAGEEEVPGFVVPYHWENTSDTRHCYVTIRFLRGGQVTLRGEEAQYHQQAVGGAWFHDMPVLVKYHGANLYEITPRDDQENQGQGTGR